jgi:threonine/homoserine/homoserine lactone efflux protein
MTPALLMAASLFILSSSITPGPNNTMLMASGVNFGFRRSLRHLLGVQVGFAILLCSVGLGLHAVLDRVPQLYTLLRYLGSAYMLWMAWKLATTRAALTDPLFTRQPLGFWGAVAFQWVNPKAWFMAVTFMSTYLAPGAQLPQILLLALLFMLLGGPCAVFWLGFGQAMRRLLQNPSHLRLFNVTMALALVASLYPMLTV